MSKSDQIEHLNSEMARLRADFVHLDALYTFDPNFDEAVRQMERHHAELARFLAQEAQRCSNRLAELELLALGMSISSPPTGSAVA